jgi:hypothetical protein
MPSRRASKKPSQVLGSTVVTAESERQPALGSESSPTLCFSGTLLLASIVWAVVADASAPGPTLSFAGGLVLVGLNVFAGLAGFMLGRFAAGLPRASTPVAPVVGGLVALSASWCAGHAIDPLFAVPVLFASSLVVGAVTRTLGVRNDRRETVNC